MNAALEAWGADSNLFRQGAARESHDPDIVAATLSKPGVILKRPVGSDGPFKENAELPTHQPGDGGRRPKKTRTKSKKPGCGTQGRARLQKEEKRREREHRREDAARDKERERRQRAIDKPRQPSVRPNGSTTRGRRRSRPNATPSKRDRKPRMRAGKGKRKSCRARCAERETRPSQWQSRWAAGELDKGWDRLEIFSLPP
jgi:hypothetical protein